MQFVSAIVQIVLINLVLSGDNAVVIGMAAHRLPPGQRRMAIVFGGSAAIVLRIVLTIAAAELLKISGLQIAGGLVLIWIGFKLLAEEEEEAHGVKVAHSMKDAIITIFVADFIMSLDNVIGVAAVAAESKNTFTLLVFGLILSMCIIMFMGSLAADLVNRFTWLAYVGSAVILWTGATMIFEDPYLVRRVDFSKVAVQAIAAGITGITLVFAHWFYRVREK